MIYVWICLIKCPKNSFKFHQELAPLCRKKLLQYIFKHYSLVYILMVFLVLNQQYKRTSIQTRSHVGKRGALGLAYWWMSIITTTKRSNIFVLKLATATPSNRHWLLGGWYPLRLITHQKRYCLSDYNNFIRILIYLQGAWNSLHTWCSCTSLSIDWLIDGLIDHCLASNEQYGSYIHDENKFNHNITTI